MNPSLPRFKNRDAAGRRLALSLAPYRDRRPLVLGVPSGGAGLAATIARELGGDLDLALVRSLQAPGSVGRPIGAIAENGVAYLQEGWEASATPAELQAEGDQALQSLRRLRQRYTPQAVPINPFGRLTILADDGAATGAMLTAQLLSLRESGARELITVLAVASVETLELLRHEADVLLCLHPREPFDTLASHYEELEETTDKEIRDFLRKASRVPFTRGAG